MIEGDRTQPRVNRPINRSTPIPKLTLDWEKRAKSLEQEVESQARLIVELKEELAGQDERIRRLEGLSVRAGML